MSQRPEKFEGPVGEEQVLLVFPLFMSSDIFIEIVPSVFSGKLPCSDLELLSTPTPVFNDIVDDDDDDGYKTLQVWKHWKFLRLGYRDFCNLSLETAL